MLLFALAEKSFIRAYQHRFYIYSCIGYEINVDSAMLEQRKMDDFLI